MFFCWLGIFFLSASGLFMLPVYAAADVYAGAAVLTFGILSISTGFRISEVTVPQPAKAVFLLLLIPLFSGVTVFRFPFSLPLYLIIAGMFLYLIPFAFIKRLSCGVLISGLIMSVQTGLFVPYLKIAARFHEANFLTPLVYRILKIFGVQCAYSQKTIFVSTPREIICFVTTWEKLGFYFFITFFAATLVIIFIGADNKNKFFRLKSAAYVFFILFLYSIVRYVLLCLIFTDIYMPEIFWKPSIVACSYLPLPFLLAKTVNLNSTKNVLNSFFSFSPKPVSLGIAIFALCFSFAGCCWFNDPGLKKNGRVLIDEYYSNWEWTDKKLDTQWYGIQSVYNYYCFADYINHFFSVKRLKKPLDRKTLHQCDILVIKTPTKSFSRKEIEEILEFVNKGGGLFLIGDHTNVFGTTLNLNPLAARFGIRFNFDATYDLLTSDLHLHADNMIFSHPAVADMPYFLFATSCSIYAPLTAEDIMIASNLKAMHLDYSRGGYFPDKIKEKSFRFGAFLQSVGIKYGKGRVIAFADSTCFSNFYMHIAGKPEYALGAVNWLNRKNHYAIPVKIAFMSIMLFSLVFIVVKTKTGLAGAISSGFIVFWSVSGLVSGAFLLNLLTHTFCQVPKAHTPVVRIGFEEKYCDFHIPSKKLLHNPQIDYQTFYVWTQRLGYVPELFCLDRLNNDALDMVVFVNPVKFFSEEDIRKIENYIINGGRVLIIDNPANSNSSAPQIAAMFGLKICYDQAVKNVGIYDQSNKIGVIKHFAPIEGGQKLIITGQGKSFLSIVKKGRGILAVMACSSSFTNKEMGETETVPNTHQQFLYRLEFWLLKGLIQNKFDSFQEK